MFDRTAWQGTEFSSVVPCTERTVLALVHTKVYNPFLYTYPNIHTYSSFVAVGITLVHIRFSTLVKHKYYYAMSI